MKNKIRPEKKIATPVVTKAKKVSLSLFDKTENALGSRKNTILFGIIFLSVTLALLQFNYRISEANDDSMYLEGAFKFANNFFGFYTANAPFYPMLLSIVIRVFGFKLFILKFTGIVFLIFNLYFLFKAFEKRMPYYIVFFIVLFSAINSYMLYYASMTFTEQFFLMQQGLFFFLFFKAYDNLNIEKSKLAQIINWLPVGLCLFVLSMSRNVGIAIIIPVAVFFVFDKRLIQFVYFVVAFSLFRVPFELIRKAIWGSQDQFSNQFTVLIRQKDPYDATKGVEDFSGFIDRFTGNYGLYICKRFYQVLGFLADTDVIINKGLGFLFFILMTFSVFYILKSKNKHALFTLLYVGTLTCITFFAVQIRWDQLRLILVFMPLIFVVFLFSFYYLLKNKSSFSQFLLLLVCGLIIFSMLISTTKKSIANYPILRHNFNGDMYYGYTEDWQNYLKMSGWCADSLPSGSYVACRKAPMSFIYGKGKEFYPVYQVFNTDPDTVLNTFQQNKVTHVLLASLRRDPKKNDGYIINTLHRIMQPISQKYPQKLTLVKQIGKTEPAYLYKINY